MFRYISILITSLFFIILSAKAVQAQATNGSIDRETSFGLRGGLTLYTVDTEFSGGFFGSVSETSSSKIGFAVGAFAEIPLTNVFSFQPELLFVQKGGSDEADPFDGDDLIEEEGSESITFNYLDLPLLARVNVPIEGSVSPYAVAGPSIGFLLSASASNGFDEDIDDFYNSINIGLVFGAGVEFGKLAVDLRYDLGLTNIFDDSALQSVFDDDPDGDFDDFFGDLFSDIDLSQKTSGILLTIGLKF